MIETGIGANNHVQHKRNLKLLFSHRYYTVKEKSSLTSVIKTKRQGLTVDSRGSTYHKAHNPTERLFLVLRRQSKSLKSYNFIVVIISKLLKKGGWKEMACNLHQIKKERKISMLHVPFYYFIYYCNFKIKNKPLFFFC